MYCLLIIPSSIYECYNRFILNNDVVEILGKEDVTTAIAVYQRSDLNLPIATIDVIVRLVYDRKTLRSYSKGFSFVRPAWALSIG